MDDPTLMEALEAMKAELEALGCTVTITVEEDMPTVHVGLPPGKFSQLQQQIDEREGDQRRG